MMKLFFGQIWRPHITPKIHWPIYKKRQIEYVSKDFNPPNVPQLRPIENFWAMLRRKVYHNSYQAKTSKNLIVKIKKELKTIALNGIQRAMREVPMKVRKATKLGVDYFLK